MPWYIELKLSNKELEINLKSAVKWLLHSKKDNSATNEHDHLMVSIRPDKGKEDELYLGHLSSATNRQKATAASQLNLIAESASIPLRAQALDRYIEEQVSSIRIKWFYFMTNRLTNM